MLNKLFGNGRVGEVEHGASERERGLDIEIK